MTPPTIEEVRAYIIEMDFTTVDATEFVVKLTADDWCNGKGKSYKNWKGVVVTWHYNNLRWGRPRNLCRKCKKYGVYQGGDDTGQQYWLCEDHKPQPRAVLPEELTENVFKTPPRTINIHNEQCKQMKDLRSQR
ncbi:hypothetical protein LCGC14_0357820 [marine sediment metagenome]|uniref:Uncharacterized protein n=1 Tax=marine sediment metagenome TaxID=412755 RepID=A0A0F9TRS6_9ZZZZ